MCSSQMMKTEILINFIGFIIDQEPGPILAVEPRADDAKTLSKDRIAPMLRDTPCLQGKVADVRSRDSGNTTLHKSFVGGHLTFVGAISPSGLAMRPIRYALLDEVDRYPMSAGTEGDPIALAVRRTDEFAWNKKILKCSTPTIEGVSKIAAAYEESDQRKPLVPCPLCGEMQVLMFSGIVWESNDFEHAQYQCSGCKQLIPHHKKAWMLKNGKWVAQNPDSKVPGFWISQLYSTRRTWGQIAKEFSVARKSVEQLKTFTNTVLAETWKERGEAPAWRAIYDRAEDYAHKTVPRAGLFLTASGDVQQDRIEVDYYAWGRNRESWLVDHIVIPGDPARSEIWEQVTVALNLSFRHESGRQMSAVRFAIDSRYSTRDVYAWVSKQGPGRVMAVRGVVTGAAALGQPSATDVMANGQKRRRGVKVWPVVGPLIKSQLYGWLRLQAPINPEDSYPAGYCHFPKMDPEFFQQLVAEEIHVKKNKSGFQVSEWVKTRERNEALDNRVYATAAAISFGLDRFQEHNWRQLEAALVIPKEEPVKEAPAPQPRPLSPPIPNPTPRQSQYQPVRSSFMNR